ncbi:winged helix-turn-helix transcriptional regulator [Streptomyces odorifer]|uniref:Winged helix-turn-helix transcriptional regulator n=1 Tax=Streptomyces odorifer TaxID=53450 RepID=A0A7Y6C8C1_9ACTN|nr:winged helix-turn-helix transcriptional regulator [Streptomyces odorifer]NUV35463.1 winged helix-turn-helix transcriptional regulator [Streptomyces sp. KAI-27]NUV46635.1 winged helix-turn-helix transcriptional regulator [Streptomyces sp. CAI-78]
MRGRPARGQKTASGLTASPVVSETALSVVELARRAGVTRQTTHRAVTQLVGEGLLVGEPGPGVPRSTLIRLTDAGRRRRDVALGSLRGLEEELAKRLGSETVAGLRDTLTRAWPS